MIRKCSSINEAKTDTYLHLNKTQGFFGFRGIYDDVLEVDQVCCIYYLTGDFTVTDCKCTTTTKIPQQTTQMFGCFVFFVNTVPREIPF